MVIGADVRGSWPLVARDEELALLHAVVSAAEASEAFGPHRRAGAVVVGAAGVGKSRLVREVIGPHRRAGAVVVGAAGVGKSRLVREVIDDSARRGLATAWVMTTAAGATVPYGAFSHLAPASLPSASQDRFALHLAFAEELTARAAGRHLVVGVDDAHLLDPAGALLLAHLAQTGTATILATIRQGEPVPDPITALWRNDLVTRVDLQRLSRTEVGRLAAAILGGESDVRRCCA